MYIVFTYDNDEQTYKRHSAWNTEKEAFHQRTTLLEHGYQKVIIEKDEFTNAENGHYYV